MKNKLFNILLLSLVGLISCDSSKISNDVPFLIDLTISHGFDSLISPRELMTNVEYIKLGSPEKFYLSEAEKIVEFNDKIFILDKNKRVVVAYNLQGNFIGQVGRKGRGPEEYNSVYDFVVSPKKNSILLWSSADNAIFEFGTDLSFKKRITCDVFASQMSLLESGNVAFYTYFGNTNFNIPIYNLKGKQINRRMPFPPNGNYIPMDFSGFIVGNYYTYPLSSKIYKILEEKKPDSFVFEINYAGRRQEEKKFDHSDYVKNPNENILSRFTLGKDAKELLLYYSYVDPDFQGYSLGVKLSGGQVFGHLDLKHGWKSQSDIFSKLFFSGPYNFPTYSRASGYYYMGVQNDAMCLFHNGEDEFHAIDKKATLNEIKQIDYDLYTMLKEHKDDDNPILMKFKLRQSYDYE